jgi:hypothetical protein
MILLDVGDQLMVAEKWEIGIPCALNCPIHESTLLLLQPYIIPKTYIYI